MPLKPVPALEAELVGVSCGNQDVVFAATMMLIAERYGFEVTAFSGFAFEVMDLRWAVDPHSPLAHYATELGDRIHPLLFISRWGSALHLIGSNFLMLEPMQI